MSNELVEPTVVLNEDQILDFTQSVRLKLVEAITAGGKMPEGKEDRTTLLQTLDGLDRASLGKKKIAVDQNMADTAAKAAGYISEMLKQTSGMKAKPFVAPLGITGTIPVLELDIPEPVLVPGESDIYQPQLTHAEFMGNQDS